MGSFLYSFVCLTGVFTAALVLAAIMTRVAYAVSDRIAEAPLLDFFISVFTWIPWVAGAWLAGWWGLLASVLSQLLVLHLFCIVHRSVYGKKGKTIMETNNRLIGTLSNQVALFVQLPAVATFVSIRFSQYTVYPFLCLLAGLPRYKQNEWVNLSRHKFSGLIGYDLLWCWYCDWMTGVWALGSEMLRNIESFWCPIRFQSPAKNNNISLDFPDVKEWVPADGDISDVVRLVEDKYEGRKVNSWWGHQGRKD
jgi:hypothetical protein